MPKPVIAVVPGWAAGGGPAYMTDEAVEGRDAFLEKRAPDFGNFPYYFWDTSSPLCDGAVRTGRTVACR